MTKNLSKLAAQQARDAYSEKRSARQRNTGARDLVLLEILEALPNGEGLEENLLPIEALTKDLTLRIATMWPGSLHPDPGRIEEVEIYLDNALRNQFSYTLPFEDDMFPLDVTIPKEFFQGEKRYETHYIVYNANGIPESSGKTVFNVDKTAPDLGRHPQPLLFDIGTITPEYLEANDGKLIGTVPRYPDIKPGDVVLAFLAQNMENHGLPVDTITVPVDGFDPDMELTVTYTEAELSKHPDGNLYFAYVLIDRAGNEGQISIAKRLQLALFPAPANLPDPVVPLAEAPDNLIDREDHALGVTVEVGRFDNWQPGDVVVVEWGPREIARVTLSDEGQFPLTPTVSWSVLQAGGDGPKAVDVKYRVLRGTREFLSNVLTVNVDLRVPGPVNPDPDPENPSLSRVTVLGGGANPVPNKIRVEDKRFNANASATIYAPISAGEVVQLYWNNVIVPGAEYTIIGDEPDDFEFSFTVPWTLIEQEGDHPELPVHYTITSPELPNGQQSVPTPVEVNTFEIGALAPPSFPDRNRFGAVACVERVWEGVKVRVEGDTANFAQGDTVTIFWEGYTSNDVLIPDTSGNDSRQLTELEASGGFVFTIPFRPFINAIGEARSGYLQAQYRLEKAVGGGSGSSSWTRVFIGTYTPGNCNCIAEGVCPI